MTAAIQSRFPLASLLLALGIVLGCQGSGPNQKGTVPEVPMLPVPDVLATVNTDHDLLDDFSLSPNGAMLACCTSDRGKHWVSIWDPTTAKRCIAIPIRNTGYPLQFSPNSSTLLCQEGHRAFAVFDVKTWRQVKSIDRLLFSPEIVTFSPNGKLLAIGCHVEGGGAAILLWNLLFEKVALTLKPELFSLDAIAFSPDGRVLISGGNGGPIVGWSTDTGKQLWSLDSHYVPASGKILVNSIAFDPYGRKFATGGDDPLVQTWDLGTRKEVTIFKEGNKGPVTCVAYSPDGRLLAASFGRGHGASDVIFWEAGTGKCLARLRPTFHFGIRKIQFFPDGRRLVVGAGGGESNAIEIWKLDSVWNFMNGK